MPSFTQPTTLAPAQPQASFLNVAAYHFVPLDDLTRRRKDLKSACDAASLRGTILLSREGINLFIAGEEMPLRNLLATLTSQPEFQDLEVKESWSDYQPFNRMLVRLKTEIISMGIDGIDPRHRPAPKLPAPELRRWLDEGRDVLLLDVRNDYEVGVGTFRNAMPIGIDHFRHFPQAVETLPDDLKGKPVVMFCTGGIRCEKAGPLMQQRGFTNIFQLDGGILKYFEECGGAHYDGDCFVFDKRVALNPSLEESGLGMCYVCQAILSPEDQASPEYVVDQSCPYCISNHAPKLPTIAERNEQLRESLVQLPGSIAYDNVKPIRIPERLDGMTLTQCVADLFPHVSESYWVEEFSGGRVRLGDRVVDGETVARSGQRYSHWFPDTIEPDVNADIHVLFEDESLLIVNKPAPLPMHPSGRFNRNTLVWMLRNALSLPHLRPVHRLDANTTGVAIFAKSKAVAGQLQRQFDSGQVQKTYLARCHGVPGEDRFECNAPISVERTTAGGREIASEDAEEITSHAAETRFVRLEAFEDQSALLEVTPVTGRTNQIRLHLWHLGHPIVGDPLYLPEGKMGDTQTMDFDGQAASPMRLHAWRVTVKHPHDGESLTVEAEKPAWVR